MTVGAGRTEGQGAGLESEDSQSVRREGGHHEAPEAPRASGSHPSPTYI